MSNEDIGIYTPDEVREIFDNFIEDIVKEDYFQALLQLTRKAADCARKDIEVRETLTRKLDMSVKCYPKLEKSANIFRAIYIDGDTRPTYKEIGERFFIDKRTVSRHTDKVFRILVVMLFGVAGVDWESVENSETHA